MPTGTKGSKQPRVVTVRMSVKLHELLKQYAKDRCMAMNTACLDSLEQTVENQQVQMTGWVDDKQVNEQCWWWWWNGDIDSCPVPVSVMWSGSNDTYFASQGQLGWTRAQDVIGMGGLWLKIKEPSTPTEHTPYWP